MPLGRDALCAAADWIVRAEQLAHTTPELVATIGELTLDPGASNVIPSRTKLSLDLRHPDDATREQAASQLREHAVAVKESRGVEHRWELLPETAARRLLPTAR